MGTVSGAFRQNGARSAMGPAEPVAVKVWLGRIPEDVSAVAAPVEWVTSEEVAEAAARPPALRKAWLFRRAFRRRILSDALGIHCAELGFVIGPAGKPSLLIRGRRSDWQFSSSHSRGLVGLALVQGEPIGVDLECCLDLPDQPRLAAGFPEPWASRLQQAPTVEFYRAWVAWEAVAKAVGCGLGPGLKRFLPVHPQAEWAARNSGCSDGADGISATLELRDTDTGCRWWVTEFEAPPGFVGALAAPRPFSVGVRDFNW